MGPKRTFRELRHATVDLKNGFPCHFQGRSGGMSGGFAQPGQQQVADKDCILQYASHVACIVVGDKDCILQYA
jgi:hypothetical protein